MPTGHRGGASPTPPSAGVAGVSVSDSPAGVVVAAGSTPLAVDVAAGVVALAGNAGRQISPPPGGAMSPRAVRWAFRRGVLTVCSGGPGGGSLSGVSFVQGFRF